jgi:hypothetical protein
MSYLGYELYFPGPVRRPVFCAFLFEAAIRNGMAVLLYLMTSDAMS